MRQLTEAAEAVETMLEKQALGYLTEAKGLKDEAMAEFKVIVRRGADNKEIVSLIVHDDHEVISKEVTSGDRAGGDLYEKIFDTVRKLLK